MSFDPKPLEDFSMWAALQAGGQTANIPLLKELVGDWIQMTTQKTAGQRKDNPKDLSWDNLERVKMGILCEAVALVLSGKLDEIDRRGTWKKVKGNVYECSNCGHLETGETRTRFCSVCGQRNDGEDEDEAD